MDLDLEFVMEFVVWVWVERNEMCLREMKT